MQYRVQYHTGIKIKDTHTINEFQATVLNKGGKAKQKWTI